MAPRLSPTLDQREPTRARQRLGALSDVTTHRELGEVAVAGELHAGLRPCHAGLRPCHAGLRPCHAGLRPCHAGLALRHSGREAGIQAKDGPSQTTPALIWLRDSGYIRLQAGPALALLDVAPIGPDYLPGHAHADTLSFELSIFGQRLIVNGGTSRYGTGPERLAERGTAAHSTVQIDGADSSEVWGGFRVARRARPFDVVVNDLMPGSDHHRPGSVGPGATPVYQEPAQGFQEPLVVSAAHDGYRRLPGRPVHRRQWLLAEDRLVVTDRIEGDCRSAVARFHLHPEVEASIEGTQGVLRLPDGDGPRVRWGVTGGQPRLVADRWHPEFGRSLPSQCLEVVIEGDQCALELSWQT
ncbi:MAG: heparinase II/III-family protein [Chromatiaceae bacterium]|nr:heparinase II/III-family protein [Chromatiaceae bacterium]MCF7996342.1 heparinase II/III-family protein [Chromatiaceae bacterium]MCF8004895.1 heparinase II/III-family protein [Chromatiaceae bacterium]MCF8015990.1 heparinase II/III-family protein [Chromatiaceae bacterium]